MARPQLSKEFVNESASESSSSTSGEESDKDETTLPIEPKSVLKQNGGKQQPDGDGSSSNSDADSDDLGSEESSESSAPNDLKRKKSSQETSSPTKKAKSAPLHIPSRSYQPPTGYLPIRSDGHSPVLTSRSLSDKQIWHLIVPASVPISKLKSFDLQAALRGETILEHKGVKYHVHATSAPNDSLLLPLANPVSTGRGSEVTVAYESSAVPVSRALYLREQTSRPLTSSSTQQTGSSSQGHDKSQTQDTGAQTINFFASQTGSKRQPRQQPKGLMMRYHPFGSKQSGKEVIPNTEDDDMPDEEEVLEPQVNGFEVPAEVSDDDRMDIDVVPTTSDTSKSNKKKRSKDRGDQGTVEQVTETPKKAKKSKKDKSHLSNGDDLLTNGDIVLDHQKEPKEKKKEKHRKKEKKSVEI